MNQKHIDELRGALTWIKEVCEEEADALRRRGERLVPFPRLAGEAKKALKVLDRVEKKARVDA